MAGPRRRGLRDKLGIPPLAGRRGLAVAQVADSLGDGMFIPFGTVYFVQTTALQPHTVGLCLSVAGLLALPVVALSGGLVDRFSAASVVIAGNVVSAVAFTCYLTVAHAWQLVTFALLATAGTRLFGTANLALVGDSARLEDRSQWLAFLRAARNAGFGLGGVLGAAVVGGGTHTGYHLLAVCQAASCALAGGLVFAWSRPRRASLPPGPPGRSGPDGPERPAAGTGRGVPGGYRAALADQRLMLLSATNFLFVLCVMSLEVLEPVDLIRNLHQRAWLTGALFAVNTAIVAAGQTVASRAVQPLRPARALRFAALTWGASFLLLLALGTEPRPVVIPGLLVAVILYTAAELVQNPTLNALVIATAPAPVRGRYLAVYQSSWALGQAVAPGLLIWLLSLGRAWAWLTLAGVCAVIAFTPRPLRFR